MVKKSKKLPEWERLLSAQAVFQEKFPELILVGGTAAALHAQHRFSIDADHIAPDLKKHFEVILRQVEQVAGWKTSRMEPPVLILGNFQGVRTGIRQLIRKKPLETTRIRGLKVPTVSEIVRIKAYLICKRNATRDFIDFIALWDHMGVKKSLAALTSLDDCYPQDNKESMTRQLALQLAEPKPYDLSDTDLSKYKSLKEPYTHWCEVEKRMKSASVNIIESLL